MPQAFAQGGARLRRLSRSLASRSKRRCRLQRRADAANRAPTHLPCVERKAGALAGRAGSSPARHESGCRGDSRGSCYSCSRAAAGGNSSASPGGAAVSWARLRTPAARLKRGTGSSGDAGGSAGVCLLVEDEASGGRVGGAARSGDGVSAARSHRPPGGVLCGVSNERFRIIARRECGGSSRMPRRLSQTAQARHYVRAERDQSQVGSVGVSWEHQHAGDERGDRYCPELAWHGDSVQRLRAERSQHDRGGEADGATASGAPAEKVMHRDARSARRMRLVAGGRRRSWRAARRRRRAERRSRV